MTTLGLNKNKYFKHKTINIKKTKFHIQTHNLPQFSLTIDTYFINEYNLKC